MDNFGEGKTMLKAIRRLSISLLAMLFLVLSLVLVIAGCGGGGGFGGNQGPVAHSFGPESVNIGTGSGDFSLGFVGSGYRLNFSFSVAGAPVKASVIDPYGNTILSCNSGDKAMSGQGSFIASSGGDYKLRFLSSGIITPSVVTVRYVYYY